MGSPALVQKMENPGSSSSESPTTLPCQVQQKYSLLDDYSGGAHPKLLNALRDCNDSQEDAYGNDSFSHKARLYIRNCLGTEHAGIFFVPSGTSANAISIAACLRPHEAVIAATSAHIVTRETGAVEAGGHKIITVVPQNGKLTPGSIQKAINDNWHFPHMAKPRMVYISNATEIGTIYLKRELMAIKSLCEANGMLLFVDGARIGSALVSSSNDLTLQDVYEFTDIFWIGGTKNGALLGEAVVVKDQNLARDFDFFIKQRGCLLAKSRIMGVQFARLFEDSLFFDLASAANTAASTLGKIIIDAGFQLLAEVETNQVFAILPASVVRALKQEFKFYVWEALDNDKVVIRLLTTWATDLQRLNRFSQVIRWTSTS